MLTLPPLSLYVHIPWCVRKCPYCDFNSHQRDGALPEDAYVAALAMDLDADAAFAQGRQLTSIFFGGGTPSLFSAAAIGRILSHAERTVGFASDIEITLEANPGTVEQARFRDYLSAGINRLSIGIQSFDDQQLVKLGRVHDSQAARQAINTARRAGFDNINLDLMHGLPEQNSQSALHDLHSALEFNPEHLSWYQLTIEPNTVFYSAPPTIPADDTLADIQDTGHALLLAAGFNRYEVSAYARGSRARHNMNYWEFGDYLGIGAGAHGKVSYADTGEIFRYHKTRQPEHYLAAPHQPKRFTNAFCAGQTPLTTEALPLEFLLNALRLSEGCPTEYFVTRTGLPISALEPQWQQLQARGLVEPYDKSLIATGLGQRFLNDVLGSWM